MDGSARHQLPGRNHLLASLAPDNYALLEPHLDPFPLSVGQPLYEPGEPIRYVYFPLAGVVSLVRVMEDGAAAEVATIGNEGMVGVPVFLEAESGGSRAFCQVPGEALRMRATTLRHLTRADGPLRRLLARYAQALFDQVAQTAACNRLHPVEQRGARWLLMTHDRVDSDRFPLTQAFLAGMLGVRRARVNQAAGVLQRAGLITYTRGRITVRDRPGLEAAACACYRVVRAEFDRLLGPVPD